MLAEQLNHFDSLATVCVTCSKATRWEYGSRFHVFTYDLHCRRIARQEIPPHPIRAANELPHLCLIVQRRKVSYRVSLLALMS